MKRLRTFCRWLPLLMLMLCVSFTFAQTPTAVIKIEGYSPQEIHDLGWASPRSTGLAVVGVGQVVYLIGRDSLNAAVTSYSWSFSARPTGSTAALDSTTTRQTTFKPDVEGKFTVQLVITTAGGTSSPRAVTITSAKFVGVGGFDGLPINVAEGQCGVCHSFNLDQWLQTGHATFFKRAIDGGAGSHYQESCIECHTIGHDTSPTANNNGFDDVQREVGWVFPPQLQPGNWNALVTNYPRLAVRANVQCESCHGPGSQHFGVKSGIAMSLDEATCGYCHEEEPYHRKSTQWKNSLHAVGVASASTNPSCVKCHSGWGFIRRIDPRTNDQRPGSGFPQISCAVCHDPHRAELPAQVRSLNDVTLGDSVTVVNYGGRGKLCMQCHISRQDAEDYTNNPNNLNTRFGPHHSNQADMIDGSNAIEYNIPIGSSGHKFAVENACVTCHMQATLPEGQPGHDEVGEHTFAMRWDGGTPNDASDDVEHVAVCQSCHGPLQSFDTILAKADFDEDGTIESTRHEIDGLLHKLDTLLPPRTNNNVIKANYDWTLPGLPQAEIEQRQLYTKAWYNFLFVEEDGSHGVHNAGYSIALLRRSIMSLTTGDIGASEIISITDVPNDQGKQVRVEWSKFPGDGFSANPILGYALWRRVDESPAPEAIQVSSKTELMKKSLAANLGKRFTIAQAESWDFVAWIPAIAQEMYSVVAPTLYDSTSAGIHWSVFFVSGQNRSEVFETAPDSGYSVDNLAPSPPTNISISSANKTVSLKWSEPVDDDFRYFAVYRSNTSGFDPKGTTPLATLIGTEYLDIEVLTGVTFYYRLSAFDFSGNESAYSPEVSVVVTSVEERSSGIPTDYALEQNYPNPFNPETSIRYQLPKTGHVRIAIYDALGRKIRQLLDRSQAAAYHVVVWDGRDDAGNALPSGVYFYRLESGGFTMMKKMIMMK